MRKETYAIGTAALACCLLAALYCPAGAFELEEHAGIAQAAIEQTCGGRTDRFCAELKEYLPFVKYGAVMEDTARHGRTHILETVFQGKASRMVFGGADEELVYGAEETPGMERCCIPSLGCIPACNHYYLLIDEAGEPQDEDHRMPCGNNAYEATAHHPGAPCWEDARSRGVRILKSVEARLKEARAARGGDNRRLLAYSYYWLGRGLHLLADTGVPAHIIAHKLNSAVETDHRCYEYFAWTAGLSKELAAAPAAVLPAPADYGAVFSGMARSTLGKWLDDGRPAKTGYALKTLDFANASGLCNVLNEENPGYKAAMLRYASAIMAEAAGRSGQLLTLLRENLGE